MAYTKCVATLWQARFYLLSSRVERLPRGKSHMYALRIYFYTVFCFLLKVQESATKQNAMPQVRRLNVELTKEKLDTMLDGLGKIRDQLSSVSK